MSVARTRPARPLSRARARVAALFIAIAGLAAPLVVPLPAGAVETANGSSNVRYLMDTYRDLLGRDVDEAGLDYQLNVIKAGGDHSRRIVTHALLFSAEGSRQEVTRAYDELLHRAPDAGGADYWTAHLQGRGVLDLRVLLLASDEYHQQAGGTDEAWLDAVYLDVLGRGTDSAGEAYWLDLVRRGVPRPLIVAGVYLSDESLGHRVDAYYLEALGRSLGAPERAGAIAIIRSKGERGLRAELWASDERFERYLVPVLT